ncbi:hypothetical protein CGMCC3_g6698 [Colletotrichum fructicola]|nr:uncharacterized protein CGMCC3_g6698 [Colletotrichum fructicola]KAE9577489.1 hypothetical protein CGMCC3_g6698 [Colletotrichum fructicola]KAF5503512.1 hypothetical protein CGCF413_v005300 [Colletotrichum fructicola]
MTASGKPENSAPGKLRYSTGTPYPTLSARLRGVSHNLQTCQIRSPDPHGKPQVLITGSYLAATASTAHPPSRALQLISSAVLQLRPDPSLRRPCLGATDIANTSTR